MPLDVQVDPDRRIIIVAGRGVVTDQDLLVYVEEYLGGQEYSEYDELFDLAEADLRDLTYPGLSAVAKAAAATDPRTTPTKIALLVSETFALGISRMYQTLRENKGGLRATRVFWDRSECLEWLGFSE